MAPESIAKLTRIGHGDYSTRWNGCFCCILILD
jgi:hypothetical protein